MGVSAGGDGGRSPSSFHACWLYFAPDAMRYLNAGNASSPAVHRNAFEGVLSKALCFVEDLLVFFT